METPDHYVIEHNDVVPSMNSSSSGYKSAHWSTGHKIKKQWQQDLSLRLMQAQVPRNVYSYVEVSAVLTFTRPARRDPENFRVVLSKAFGDAMTAGRWIPDDAPQYFKFTDLVIDKGPVKKTTLTIKAWRAKPMKEE